MAREGKGKVVAKASNDETKMIKKKADAKAKVAAVVEAPAKKESKKVAKVSFL
jgi:Na+-transporting methylmalonyl-CoA/oxaloacetate decarboxylase gamma subunit